MRISKLKNKFKFPYFFLTGFGLFWILTWFHLMGGRAISQPVPDFSNFSFDSLPPLSEDGSVSLPTGVNSSYNPSRTWTAGQDVSSVLKLGDFEGGFNLQKLNLDQIASKLGLSLSKIALSEFSLIPQQNLGNLLQIVPNLKNKSLRDLPLFQDLLRQNYDISGVLAQPLGQIVTDYNLEELSLKTLDLSQYSLEAIPGLKGVKFEQFTGWQNATLDGIPGLSSLPFEAFPNPPVFSGGGVATVDLVLSDRESQANRSISGSFQEGFNVSCSRNCAHIELGGNPLINGKQWVSGKSQKVNGGFGTFQSLFAGKEPTGRHPFGDSFKVVVWNIDESTGTVETAWFFRICSQGLINLGCSPYGLGPIPAFSYQENDSIFVGL